MKKTLFALFLLLSVILTACSSSDTETYFIHAVGFDKTGGEYSIHAVCEKVHGKNEDYITLTGKGNSIEAATKKLANEYKDCYFATSKLYFIRQDAEKQLIYDIAKEICDSNIYPSKSSIVCISGTDLTDFIKSIKSEDELRNITKLTQEKNTNAVKFFSRFMSNKKTSIPTLKLDDNGKAQKTKSAQFHLS